MNTVWDGIITSEFTLAQFRYHCHHLAQQLLAQGWSCLVAYDTRFLSDLFAREVYYVLAQHGISVSFVPQPTPLPAINYAIQQGTSDCAVVVTARNKPYWYNGLLLIERNHTERVLTLAPVANATGSNISFASTNDTAFTSHFPEYVDVQNNVDAMQSSIEVRQPYMNMLAKLIDKNIINRSTMTIFVDPMHGSAAGYLPALIGDQTQTMAISINRELDPLFERGTPLPASAPLTRLRKLVRESDSHLGVAIAADGTAIGVIDKQGTQLECFDIAMLLVDYLTRQYRQHGTVIVPYPQNKQSISKQALDTWQKNAGIHIELSNNAGTQLGTLLAQQNHELLVGCSEHGEVVLGNISRYPDALLAGLYIIEMIARSGGSLRLLVDTLRARLSSS